MAVASEVSSTADESDDDERESSEPSEIIDRVFLGSRYEAWSESAKKKLGLTHRLQCISGIDEFDSDGRKICKVMAMCDRGRSLLAPLVDEAVEWIDSVLEESEDHSVVVHCSMGVNRSPSLVCGYLMKTQGWNLKQAYDHLSSKHSRTCIHDAYMAQLRRMDLEMFGEHSTKEDELPTTMSVMRDVLAKLAADKEDPSSSD